MNQVANAISSLLYDHHVVIVPGLGAFLCQAESAKVNVITNQFEKPTAALEFDPQQREDNDLIVDYLKTCEGMDEPSARQLVVEFVSDCYARLRAGEKVSIPEVGELSMDGNQTIQFHAVTVNAFNGDAFGLGDIQPEPIFTGSQNNWKEEVTQQLKDLNTPMTVDIKHEGDHPRRWWIWLLLLLLIAGGVAVWYFYFRPAKPEPQPEPKPEPVIPVDTLQPSTDTLVAPLDTVELPVSDTLNEPVADTMVEPVVEPLVEVVTPPVEKKVFIIGGCFSIEQNAMNMVAEEKEKGFAEAFVMKRGNMYYVCYGQYATLQEAKAELNEVWKTSPKAWILNKK